MIYTDNSNHEWISSSLIIYDGYYSDIKVEYKINDLWKQFEERFKSQSFSYYEKLDIVERETLGDIVTLYITSHYFDNITELLRKKGVEIK